MIHQALPNRIISFSFKGDNELCSYTIHTADQNRFLHRPKISGEKSTKTSNIAYNIGIVSLFYNVFNAFDKVFACLDIYSRFLIGNSFFTQCLPIKFWMLLSPSKIEKKARRKVSNYDELRWVKFRKKRGSHKERD